MWSSRRAAIDTRSAELAARFQAEHGRPPTPVEALKLAQQATLETRQAKHEPRSHAEQRATWRADAGQALGGDRQVEAMLDALPRARTDRRVLGLAVSADWVADTAQAIVGVLQSSRATWRQAHVRAEAERQTRTAQVPLAQVDDAVERVVAAVLSPALSVPLGPADPDASGLPAALRRADGSSVHTVAGSRLFTSPQVLAAERQLLALAARTDGRTVGPTAVVRAVRRAAEAGLVLKRRAGRAVRDLATSGARVQLALAPAGTGKTTALRALAEAWTTGGGTVLGLAPSAAAAAVLAAELNGRDDQDHPDLRVPADTLAKLLWSLDQLADAHPVGRVPDWVRQVGPGSLVLIDEAGMAGTLDLARSAAWICDRGGSVRLVGDDRQLAAVGAGGVLRDLARTSGASGGLHDVVRFTDPAEGLASLALRAGDPVALGFYLDRQRVHQGDPEGAVEEDYAAWAADRAAGRDSLLIAPTRELALQLNTRARADRLADTTPAGAEVTLGDGSQASAGDSVLTRRNDRRLVLSPTDWVKNGDRWTVTEVLPDGALRAVHCRSRRRVLLPAQYVGEHVTLGYASTVHTAQGSTADTCHVVLTGREDRQLLYVALTRGRTGNHLYLQTADVGDEHTPPGLDVLRPPTPAEALTRILARDGAQASALSTQQALDDPAALLDQAAARYLDSVTLAAGAGPDRGRLDWQRPEGGPLPWLPVVPARLAADRDWGPHLRGEAQQVRDLARQVSERTRSWTASTAPAWAAPLISPSRDDGDLVALLAVWRAAQQVPDEDRRPAGPPGAEAGERKVQEYLQAAAASAHRTRSPAGDAWRQQLDAVAPGLRADPDWPRLAQRLDDASSQGHDVVPLVHRAVSSAPLPDELPAAALLWRLLRQLPPEQPRVRSGPAEPAPLSAHQLAAQISPTPEPVPPQARWKPLADAVDPRLSTCPSWPALAGSLERAHHAGHNVAERLPVLAAQAPFDEERPARTLTYRLVEDCPAAAPQLSAAQRAADDRQRLEALRRATSDTTRPTGPAAPARGRGPAR